MWEIYRRLLNQPFTRTEGYCVCVYVKDMAGPAAVLTALRALHRGCLSMHLRAEVLLRPASRVCSPPSRTTPARALQLCPVLCAGHNKWSKVKNIKGPKDDARARVFLKLTMMIKLAVKGEMKVVTHRWPLSVFIWLL